PGAAMVAPGATTGNAAPPTAPEATAPTTAAVDPAVAPGDGALVISTREEAWIDVSDASGRRLFFDIARAGRELTLEGAPPYTLVIGNSPAVSVRYRGEDVDLGAHANEGVARLTLGR
ncbi:MAG: DUF4115 domain-containing protein, partial [Gammaproteobacteria bacterium]